MPVQTYQYNFITNYLKFLHDTFYCTFASKRIQGFKESWGMKNKLSSNIQVRHNIKPHHNLSLEKTGKGQGPYVVQNKQFLILIQK